MRLIYITRKQPKVIWEELPRRLSSRQSHWLQWKVPNFPLPKLFLPLRRSLPKSNTPIQSPTQPPSPTTSRSTQPFYQNVECGPTDGQTDHGALRCIAVPCVNVAEGLQTIVVLYSACDASSTPCGGVHHILSPLAIITVHYGNVTECLRTSGTLADHCSALRCTTVHYGALWKRCRSLVDH